MKRALVVLSLLLSSAALACGGPDSAHLTEALEPASSHVDAWLYSGAEGWEWEPLPVTRFLYAFPVSDVEATDPARAFRDALAVGDLDAADRAARAIVEAVMDAPASDESYQEELRLAVEFIEVRPTLDKTPKPAIAAWFASTSASTTGLPSALQAIAPVRVLGASGKAIKLDAKHPRAASLRWLALREALKTDIPNGWTREELRAAAPKGFGGLMAQTDAWLRDFPDHPLADYVRLKKLRLLYLSDDEDAAWALLLEMYPRHPDRVAAEMRFLVLQGLTSSTLDPLAIPLEVALGNAESRPLSNREWDVLWRKTEVEPDAAWALAAQERLLLLAYRERRSGAASLPDAFPAKPAAPSETWAKLRLGAVMLDGRADDAAKQLALLDPKDAMVAPLTARLHLDRGAWADAIRTPGLDPAAARYLIRIAAPHEVAAALIDDPDPALRWEARLTVATRKLAKDGDWDAGARLLAAVDSDRATRWHQAGALSRASGQEATLAYARFLRDNGGQLLAGNDYDDVLFYRSLPEPQSPETVAWLTRSFSTWYAVGAYAKWLDRVDVARVSGGELARARQVLDEADRTYNTLLNYGSGEYYAWGSVLPTSEPAVTIRRVGKALRAKAP